MSRLMPIVPPIQTPYTGQIEAARRRLRECEEDYRLSAGDSRARALALHDVDIQRRRISDLVFRAQIEAWGFDAAASHREAGEAVLRGLGETGR